MRQTGGEISYEGDGFEVNETLFTYSEEEQEENKIAKNNAALVLKPKFIPVYPKMLQNGYSLIEATVFGFIEFFLTNNERFYCTNEQIAEMLNLSERSISAAISRLEGDGLIKNKYRIKAGGGKIRFIEMQKTTVPTRKICESESQNMHGIYNKIIDNKISISNDIDNISTPKEKKLIPVKQKTHIAVVEETPLPGPLPEEVETFLKDSYEKYPSTRYQIDKQQDKYVDTMMKDYNYLCKEYGEDTVKTVLAYIKQDDFRKNQIQSISKLRKKNKDGIPYIVVMMEKIQQFKPKIIDLDNMQ